MIRNVLRGNDLLASGESLLPSKGATRRFLNRHPYVLLLVTLSSWFLISFLAVSAVTDKRFAADLQQHAIELNQTAAAVTYHFERSMALLRVLPATVADNIEVITALHSFDYQSLGKIKTPEGKVSFLTTETGLVELNHYLAEKQLYLDVNVIWILAPNGDCIASSNYDTPESFIGINYADRAYFKSAMTGQQGRQYAVGRQTNVPGLFFSAPILNGKNVIGAVVVKIDIPKFSQWIQQFNCFITDDAGVVILSSDKILEHHTLVDAPIFRISPDDRDQQYKRKDFPLLKTSSFIKGNSSYEAINLPGKDGLYMLARSQQSNDGYTVSTYTKIGEAETSRSEKWQFTILIFISGATLILLAMELIRRSALEQELREKTDRLELLAMEFQSIACRAEESSLAKSQFLANMSHEIRTPMNAIIGMSYLALQSDLTSKQREQITHLHNAAESLLGIINDILDFSKVEAGKMTLEQTPFMLRDTVNEVVRLLKSKIEEKQLEFRYDEQDMMLAQNAPLLIGDALRLRQILTNIFSNAIKFTDKGFIQLGISSITQESSIRVIFSIQDSGIGMNNEQIARLFEEFTQADASTTRQYGGTGLGMAIAWKFTVLMGGKIEVKSQLGQGSCFTVDIPFAVALMGQTPLRERRRSVEIRDSLLRGTRVLLVEDNPVNRLLIVELLAMKGVLTDIAENGQEAIRKMQSLPPETFGAVLMDLQMPVLDGYETSKIIRSDPKFDTLPILALSAHVMSSEKERCLQIGMNGYINKPVNPEDLWRILTRAIRKNEPVDAVQLSQPVQIPIQSNPEISIIGVNLSSGIKRAGGDGTLYAKVVAEVLENYTSGCNDLLEFATQKDSKRGHALAHELRGVLGAIGAEQMQDALASIEEIFRIGTDPRQQIQELVHPYAILMEALRGYLVTVNAQAREVDQLHVEASVEEITWLEAFADHLGKGNFEAIELWENNSNTLGDMISQSEREQISRALQQFDFAGALKHLTTRVER